MKAQTNLTIFKVPRINDLEKLYLKSKKYIVEKGSMEHEKAALVRVTHRFISSPIMRKSFKRMNNELSIFNNTTIETLKIAYYESIGTV